MSQSWESAATPKAERVSPEGSQDGNKAHLPSSSQQTAATLNRSPAETQVVKTQDTGPLAEVHGKGMISLTFCIFPEKSAKFFNSEGTGFLQTFCFHCQSFVAKTPLS